MSPPHRRAFVLRLRLSSVPLLHGRAPLPVICHCCMAITAIIASAPMMIFHVLRSDTFHCESDAGHDDSWPSWCRGPVAAGPRTGQGHMRVSCVPRVCIISTACSASAGDQN